MKTENSKSRNELVNEAKNVSYEVKRFEESLQTTCFLFFERYLALSMLIHNESNEEAKKSFKSKLSYHDGLFNHFCEMFKGLRKFKKMSIELVGCDKIVETKYNYDDDVRFVKHEDVERIVKECEDSNKLSKIKLRHVRKESKDYDLLISSS